MTNTHPHYLYSDIVNSIKADKAVIEAMAGLLDGTIAYATDTNEFGTYSAGSDTWTWLGAGALLYVQDEGVPIGTPNTLNFVGNNIDVSISGTVARVFVTGTGNPTPVGFNAILPGIYAYATGSTSVPHNTATVMDVGAVTQNNWNGWSASEPNKIRVNETGFYMIGGNMTWGNDPGIGRRIVSLFITGSSVVWKYPSQSLLDNPTYTFPEQTVSTLQYLYSGSYIQLEALQTSSGTISNFAAGTSLWASKLIVSGSVQGSVTNVTNTTNVTNNLPGFLVQDEGTPLGTGTVFNFVGNNVTASVSGSVIQVYVTGSSGGTNASIQNEGSLILSNPSAINFTGDNVVVTSSGTVADVSISGMSLIQDVIVTSTTGSITFSNIPQNYKHLHLVGTARSTQNATASVIGIRFNGDTGNNYDYVVSYFFGAGSIGGSSAVAGSSSWFAPTTGATSPTGTFSSFEGIITDYTSTNKRKGFVTPSFDPTADTNTTLYIYYFGGKWRNSTNITSITLIDINGASFVNGCRFTLYGLP